MTNDNDWDGWRWADDKWLGQDKRMHFVGGMVAMVLCALVFGVTGRALAIASLSWWAFEIKDAIIPWEKYGRWGGDGFSYKDALASTAGACFTYLLWHAMNK